MFHLEQRLKRKVDLGNRRVRAIRQCLSMQCQIVENVASRVSVFIDYLGKLVKLQRRSSAPLNICIYTLELIIVPGEVSTTSLGIMGVIIKRTHHVPVSLANRPLMQ